MAEKQQKNNFNKQAFSKKQTEYTQRIDKVLDQVVQSLEYPHRLLDAIKYSLMTGGKRMRPCMFYATLNMFNKTLDDKADMVAASLECIHTYSLIHDDLPCMDNDDVRRGRPTNHMIYGEGTSVLAGSALLNMAYEMLFELAIFRPYHSASMCIASFSGGMGMIGGQVEDISLDDEPQPSKLQYIYLKKTAALFSACMLSAGLIAGADTKHLKLLSDFANSFGFAFQLQDDLEEHFNGTITESDTQKYNWIVAHGEQETLAELNKHLSICKETLSDLSADFNVDFFRGVLGTYFNKHEE